MTSQLHDHRAALQAVTKATEALESKLVQPDSLYRVESPLSLMDSSPKSESASIAAVAAFPPGGKMLRRVSRDNDNDSSTGRNDSFNSKKSEKLDSLERGNAPPACTSESTLVSVDSTEAKSLADMDVVKKHEEQHSPLEEPTAKKAKTSTPKVVEVNRIQFSDIRAILEHGGYRFDDQTYRRPCGMTFESPESLRNDLCAYGVSCKCDSNSAAQHEYNACSCWDKDQKSLIRSWVRLNVIRGPIALGKANQMPATKFLPLAKRLGCGPFRSRLCDGYKLPCVENPAVNGVLGLTTFRTSLDLMSFLSRFGFPEESFFDKLGDKELFDLEAFLATYKRGTFTPYPRYEETLNAASPKPRQPHTILVQDQTKRTAQPQKVRILVPACPSLANVSAVLERGGYQCNAATNEYARPCGLCFLTLQELRRDLCAYGVNCKCGSSSVQNTALECDCWSGRDKALIHHWVRHEVIRGPLKTGKVKVLNVDTILEYGGRLGFTVEESTGYFCFPDGVTTAESIQDLLSNLSRFGLPDDCSFSNLTDEERLAVENKLALFCPRANTFTIRPREPTANDSMLL